MNKMKKPIEQPNKSIKDKNKPKIKISKEIAATTFYRKFLP
ncbi:unnamed protein product [marine sediment metagenome]|uniref:Uncharacterized protein n=1 Tax=marine sediment metagenome TaxID=412755 RepID=X1VDT2_9ZZZZ